MEFSHRGVQTQPTQTTSHGGEGSVSGPGRFRRHMDNTGLGKWIRILSVVLLFCVTILVLAITSLLYYGSGNESGYVDNSKYQAVDLNIGTSNSNDQIYFGKIKKINSQYVVLQDIYYIVPSSTSGTAGGSNNYTLVKLGCELHAPYDQMVINRDHVIFWENLKSTGTVAQKIAQYVQQNPNGPNCSNSSSNASSSSSSPATSTQGSSSSKTTP